MCGVSKCNYTCGHSDTCACGAISNSAATLCEAAAGADSSRRWICKNFTVLPPTVEDMACPKCFVPTPENSVHLVVASLGAFILAHLDCEPENEEEGEGLKGAEGVAAEEETEGGKGKKTGSKACSRKRAKRNKNWKDVIELQPSLGFRGVMAWDS
ncbi:hypothetical protein MMC30_000742 [Trapelia coarctata]|nr:hypothetical protein [Trapelia coarctata]